MLHEVSFKSFNERDEVKGWIYVPAAKPQGIVQVVHGLGEHSRRYLHFITSLMEAGYIVAADDHVGHGKTALENNTWGDWGDKGFHTMMEDEQQLKEIVTKKYPDLPYFFFGHSLGSLITRDYIAKYGKELAGVTICGTLGLLPQIKEIGEQFKKEIEAGHGQESNTEMINGMFAPFFSRIKEVKIGNEWICADPYVQLDHANDPFDSFTRPMANKSYYDFIQLNEFVTAKEWFSLVPKELPIYNIAGDQDPVGDFGRAVYETSNELWNTGHQVTTKLYSGYRHEILNYKEIKNEVEQGIIDFMNETIK